MQKDSRARPHLVGLRIATDLPLVCAACGTRAGVRAGRWGLNKPLRQALTLPVVAFAIAALFLPAIASPPLSDADHSLSEVLKEAPALSGLLVALFLWSCFPAAVLLPFCLSCERSWRGRRTARVVLACSAVATWCASDAAWHTHPDSAVPWALAVASLLSVATAHAIPLTWRLRVASIGGNRVWLSGVHAEAERAYAEGGAYVDGIWRPRACPPTNERGPDLDDDLKDGGPLFVSESTASAADLEPQPRRLRMFYRSAEETIRALGLAIMLVVTGTGGWVGVHPRWGYGWWWYGGAELFELFIFVPLLLWVGWALYQLMPLGRIMATLLSLIWVSLEWVSWPHGIGLVFAAGAVVVSLLLWSSRASICFDEEHQRSVTQATPSLTRHAPVVLQAIVLTALFWCCVDAVK